MNMPANSIPKFSSGNEIKCDKSTIIRNSSSESGTSYEAGSQQQQQQQRFIVQGNPIQDIRESSTGVSITMKTQPRNKDGSSADADRKTTTRIDFGDFYPDGGWGWVITGAATLVYVLCNGFHHAFGILYLQILEQSKKDRRPDPIDTTWLGSVGLSITYFLSPIISTICQRKSPRLYAVIGGLTCALGCLFLSFSEHMEQLFISHCVVLSLGSGITISTANVMVGRYFRRKRELAEMTMVAGTGLGTAVMSVLFQELNRKIGWTHTLQCISGLMVLSIFAGSLYRSVSMYHPRRKVIMHIKSQKKSRRDRDTERQPYFDFSALRMRALQGLMFITAIVSFGMYVPFLLLVETAKRQGVDEEMQLLINVYLGLGFLAGCLILGYIIIRDSKECSISRRHLCQTCSVACGVLTLLLLMAKDQNAFALYAWGFGIFSGGYYYTIKVYTYELVKLKIMERAWGFVCAAQFLPIMLGAPIAAYINRNYQSHTAGFIMSGVTMLCGGLLFFFMPPLEKHRSNQEIIQIAKNTCSKNSAEAAALLDLDLTEAMVTKPLNNVQFIVSPSRLKQNGKDGGKIQMQCFIHHKEKEKPRQIVLSKITEEKEGLRLDFNEVSQISTNLTKINECTVSKKEKPEIETSQSHSQSCAHASDYHSDSTHSNHTGKSSSTSTSNSSKSHEPRRFKKSMDNVRVELFDPPSQEKESTATVSYDSDLYINLCEAQV